MQVEMFSEEMEMFSCLYLELVIRCQYETERERREKVPRVKQRKEKRIIERLFDKSTLINGKEKIICQYL